MVWFNVRVGNFALRFQPFGDGKENKYPVCDENKTILDYVKGTNIRGYYINPTTKEKVDKTFILVKGEVKEKLPKTKETDKYKFVDIKEINDFVNPKEYMIEASDGLKEELSSKQQALKFGFSFGGKSEPYFAYVYVNPLFNRLEMRLVRQEARKSIQYQELFAEMEDKRRLEELTLNISGIDKAKVEDLVEL